jgi:PAS domain S-box-containing protein
MGNEKILVAEDEGLVALSLKNSLEHLGYEVPATAATGDEVISKIAEFSPDLILMDIRLKGTTDGIEVANQIRKTSKVPVVYLTAHSDERTLARAKLSEPFGYIVKPYEEKSLHTTIEMALKKAAAESEVTHKRDRLASILRCIDEGVIVSDLKGTIQYINPAGREFAGYGSKLSRIYGSLGEIVRIRSLYTENSIELPISKVVEDKIAITIDNLWLDRADSSVPVDITIGPITNDLNIVSGLVVTIRDITMRLKQEGFV